MALSSRHKIAVFIAVLVGFIGFLIAGLNSQQLGSQTSPVVRAFPSMPVELLISEQIKQSPELFSDEYQLVNVWASWCGICRQEHDYLNQLQKQGVPIVGLNYRDNRSGAVNYLAQLGNPYTDVIFDPKGKLSLDLGVIGTPETYLVTRRGEIVYKHSGLLSEQAWRKHFSPYFDQSNS
ncbi:DsbE family thiol:disulfide interchange protein [Vibrio sp. TRT 29B02]|uniref:DsbE family thiol:disulfide interchange protein n=1 Tax=Vibrio sp. TRT 29B02 TaxID=3418508 RepID=UPI003CE9D1C0